MKEEKLVFRATFETDVVMEWYAPQQFKRILKMFRKELADENTHGKLERFDENGNVIFCIEE